MLKKVLSFLQSHKKISIITCVSILILFILIKALLPKADEFVIQQSITLQKDSVKKVLNATGIIKSQVGAVVKTGTRATGTIREMLVRVGDAVEKDQIIARLDDREQQAQLKQSEASLRKAETDLALLIASYPLQIKETKAQIAALQADVNYAKLDYDRKKNLVSRNLDSKNTLDEALQKVQTTSGALTAKQASLARLETEHQIEVERANQVLLQAQAEYESAQIRLSYTTIKSSITGIVSQVAAQEGETVVAGLQVAELITIIDTSHLELWVYVDETDIGQVKPGLNVEFTVDSQPNKIFTSYVVTVYPQPEIKDNIVYYQTLVYISPEDAQILRPEMTSQCKIEIERKEDVLAIPNAALKWVKGEQVVYVQKGRRWTPVKPEIGLIGQNSSEVLSGLQEGDTVAVRLTFSPKQ